ncbi:retrovirus-related pol polyprotein from transposon TNT 1-94 [Tanacetum coccineum]
MKVEESLNVTFDESPPPTKLSPLVDDDVGKEEAIENNTKVVNNSNKEDESIEVDEVVNIKESKNQPLEQVIELKNVNEELGDKSWVIAMQEKLNLFVANDVWDLVPLPITQIVIGTKWVFRNKLDENGIVSRNKARLVAQGYNQHECIDYDETYAPVARLESIRILLAIACENDFKLFQMDVKSAFLNGFINEEVYVAQTLVHQGDVKEDRVGRLQTKTSMSTEIKLNKDDEADFMDSSKYRGEIMPQINQKDYQLTKAYLPRIHHSKAMDEEVRESYRHLESRLFHEGRFVTPSFIEANNMLPTFQAVSLEPFLTLDENICPRLVFEFYHSLEIKRDEEERPYIEFKLGQFTFDLDTSQLSQIFQTPKALETFYISKWSLDSLDDHPNSPNRFAFHDRVMNPLDISRNPIKEKGKRVASPSVSSSSSSSSDGNEAPSFLEFYEELFDNEDLTDA